jgi:hypothetical protein
MAADLSKFVTDAQVALNVFRQYVDTDGDEMPEMEAAVATLDAFITKAQDVLVAADASVANLAPLASAIAAIGE